MRRNILIIADCEGVIGLLDCSIFDVCSKLMVKEVETVIRAIQDTENANIFLCDCHDKGTMTEKLSSRRDIIHIKQFWNIDFNIKYDCAILIGFHAKNGTDGIMSHSFRQDILKISLGDEEIGEIGIFANYLSYFGIPTILLSGDEAAIEEGMNISCVKNITKKINNDKYNKMYAILYNELYLNVITALTQNFVAPSYNDSHIYINLINDDLFRNIELSIIKDNKIVYKDSIDFIKRLNDLCAILITASKELNDDINAFISNLKTNYRNKDIMSLKNERLNNLISKGFITLNLQERDEILLILKNAYAY